MRGSRCSTTESNSPTTSQKKRKTKRTLTRIRIARLSPRRAFPESSPVSYRLGQAALNGPAISEPLGKRLMGYGEFGGPVLEAERDAVKCHQRVGPAISSLLKSSGPSAVIRLVVAVVIYALKSEFWRCLSHVGKKIRVATPAVANCNAAPPITGEFLLVRVKAALAHTHPKTMRPSAGKSVMLAPWAVWIPSIHTV